MNTANNFEALKQRIASSPRDNFSRGKLSHIAEVLIVDDEESFVLSLADGLSVYKKYFNLRTAPNGAEAVKILKLSSIDLVITDLSMPKMDGFELLAYMNRNYPKIPVILMTAYGTPKIEEIVSNMGIFRYLEKPLDINVVADNIFDALGINISTSDIKVQIPEQLKKGDATYISAAFLKGATIDERAKLKAQNILGTEETSKTVATFGSRSSISLDSLKKFKETTSYKKEQPDKKVVVNEVNRTAEIQEKKAILEAKAKAEAERFAREEAERKAKEAEERARQETLARQEAERKAREAEQRAEKARQEVLAREEAERKAKEAEQRAEKERQEALAREEAIKKAKAEADAEKRAKKEELARQEAERKAKEAEERARQEVLAREEAERKAREAEEIAERARQEVLAREEAERKAREAEQRAEKARQEAFAREEAIKKERARAEAEEKAKQEALARKEAEGETKEADKQKNKTKKDLKSETLQKLSAWKKN
ncbi:MAG TPA: response regulator [Smithellaceae bacterium]|nr:response regulator [Smithellaceae bacterium]HOS09770.1 response regulator [Smithellaceae bacterium]HPL50401.1 response regulator [Smithellaceae bacterium]